MTGAPNGDLLSPRCGERPWFERWRLLCCLALLHALVGRGSFFSSDEGGTFNTALALVQQHTLAIAAPGENVHPGRDGRYYSCREILPSVLSIPTCVSGLICGRLFRGVTPPEAPPEHFQSPTNWSVFLTVSCLGPLFVAATLVLLHDWLRRQGTPPGMALLLTLTAGWATPLGVYAKTIFAQVFETFFLLLAFVSVSRWRRQPAPPQILALALACCLGILARPSFVLNAAAILVFVGLSMNRTGMERFWAGFFCLAGIALGTAGTLAVNVLRWGSPWNFGYQNAYETFSTPLWSGVSGLLFSPGKGLLFFAPVVLVPLLLMRELWRTCRAETILVIALTAIYLGVYGRWYDWGGGLSWGPRFLLPLVPIWIALLGSVSARLTTGWPRGILLLTAVLGVLVQTLGVTINPHCMNAQHSAEWSWTNGHLVAYARTFARSGPDDLWILSPAAWSNPAASVLAALLVIPLVLMLGSYLWKRKEVLATFLGVSVS